MTPSDQNYSERIMIRSTPDQRRRWEQLAEADGRSLSNWIRWILEAEAKRRAKGKSR